MAISASLGVGSGIDINGLVKQLVTADGQPAFNALDRQESSTKSRLSALGKLKSALSDFQSAVQKLNKGSTFKTQQASSSNETLATATAGVGAVSGNYSLEVIQLAKAQKSISAAGLADLNAAVGEGTLNFSVGSSESFSITIDSTNNTLAGLRDAINGAADNKGITASIINVDAADGSTVSKLVLSAQKPGTANNFTVSGDGASLLQSMEPLTAGADAIIKVDGQTATRSSNSISDVIPGVTLDLKSVPPITTPPVATPFDVNVTLDSKSITEAGNGFVEAYNKLQTVMKELGKYDPATKAAGALVGDSTLRGIQSQIRQATSSLVTSAGSGANSLAMIGINIDRTGVMSLDSTKFNSVMNTNLSALSNVFSSTEGVAARLNKTLTQNLQTGGILDGQTTALNGRMKTIGDNRDKVQLRLDNLEKSLLKQFTAMDTVVGKFKSTGTYLSQQFT